MTEPLAALLADLVPAIGSLVGDAILPGTGAIVELVDPATGRLLASYASAGADIVDQAMAAALPAQAAWMALTAAERGRLMWAIGAGVRAQAGALAALERLTAGKPIRDARAEVGKVAEMFEYYAGWCDKLHGDVIPVPTSHLNYTRREPHGVVVQLTPWNAPIFTAGWQLAPALAAGNAAVIKPSELTPLTTLALGRIALAAGLPPGLVSVLLGDGRETGRLAVGHPETRQVVFVGSPETGAAIAAAAARNLVPCILELGGKSANIVFADADLVRAARGAQAAIWSGAGQSCVAGSRLLVQRPALARMLDALAEAAGRIAVGPPADEATAIGPIQNHRQWTRIDAMVQEAVAGGARLAAGGGAPADPRLAGGFYYAPTVLADVAPAMPIAQAEVFGPVLAVLPFDDEAEAVALANGTRFGLAGAVWTETVARAHRVAHALRAGTVWINGYKTIGVMSPFGGFRGSGHGRSSGHDALLAYTQPKSVWVETAAEPAMPFGYSPG